MDADPDPEPRRRNAARTRERILASAFDLFASQGYARTGIRQVTAEAGVAPSLLLRHFGSKANLFKEVLVHAIFTRGFFVRDKTGFGERMTRFMIHERDARITAMMVLAIADPESKAVAVDVSDRVVVEALADWLGPPDARPRALAMLAIMNGFVIQARYLTAGAVPARTVEAIARALQDIVDGR